MKILVINWGWIGDSIFASHIAENCKLNGYERVDLLVGFPQTAPLLRLNPLIDNVYVSKVPDFDPVTDGIDLSIYDEVYKTSGLFFNQLPLDTFNTTFKFEKLKYNYKLYTEEVALEFEDNTKPILAFQLDWHLRSANVDGPRDPQRIMEALQSRYNIYPIGGKNHWELNEETGSDFLLMASALKHCKLFFGVPGGLHVIAGGVGTKTVCTSEHVMEHYIVRGEFVGDDFEAFKDQIRPHASRLFPDETNTPDSRHELLPPHISDDEIIKYLLELEL